MNQLELFTEPPRPRLCGGCVHRNASGPSQAFGPCSILGRRHTDDTGCSMWFSNEQLIAACAPKRRVA